MSEGTVEHFPVLADADLLEEGAADVPTDLDEVQVGLWSRRVAVVGYVGAGRALGLDDCCGVIDESVTVRPGYKVHRYVVISVIRSIFCPPKWRFC